MGSDQLPERGGRWRRYPHAKRPGQAGSGITGKNHGSKIHCIRPAIGGAKSGINFDPADPRKSGVLERWYKAVMPLLKNYYGTGGDLNVDEIHDVIPITESYGLWHPQEGIVNGHFHANEPQKNPKNRTIEAGGFQSFGRPELHPKWS